MPRAGHWGGDTWWVSGRIDPGFARIQLLLPWFQHLGPQSLPTHSGLIFSLAGNCPGPSLAEKALYSPRCLLPIWLEPPFLWPRNCPESMWLVQESGVEREMSWYLISLGRVLAGGSGNIRPVPRGRQWSGGYRSPHPTTYSWDLTLKFEWFLLNSCTLSWNQERARNLSFFFQFVLI